MNLKEVYLMTHAPSPGELWLIQDNKIVMDDAKKKINDTDLLLFFLIVTYQIDKLTILYHAVLQLSSVNYTFPLNLA